jgi:hypothetical protein
MLQGHLATGGYGGIDDYVFALRRRLRIPADRVVSEVEDRLRESARTHGEAEAIARLGSPDGVARRLHLQARERATRDALRTLVVTGVTLLVGYLAVGVVEPPSRGPEGDIPLGLQWKLTFGGMFGLTAALFGVISIWQRVRDERDTALRFALASVTAAIPAVGFHITFQVDRLSSAAYDTWFIALVVTFALLRVLLLAAAFVLIARASRTIRASS